MKGSSDKNSAYLESIKKLRSIIATDYIDGGWLPPVRKMCKYFEISDLTYRKAISCLLVEGTARSYPRKGIYIKPKSQRISKVGFIVGDGGESPFWGASELICQALQYLTKEGYFAHQINASPLKTLPQKALLHEINSLIWFPQTKKVNPIIKEIQKENIFPLLVVPIHSPSENNDINSLNANIISSDYEYMNSERSRFFIERGHKKILYLGNFWFADFFGFTDNLKQANIPFSEEYCLNDTESINNKLLDFISNKKITAIVSEGGEFLEPFFKLISAIPFSEQPEILIQNHFHLKALYRKYPNINLVALGYNKETRGTIAGEMICRYLKRGEKLRTVQVPIYSIVTNLEHYFE